MNGRHWFFTLALAAGALAAPAAAQDGTLRLIVPYPAGGGSDLAARIVAEALRPRLGTNVIVENLTGAGGRVALQQVKRMAADANVLVAVNPALMVVAPLVFKDAGYDADRDFQPVSQITRYEFGVAVGAAVPVREFRHLLAWIRANPDKSNFGVPATGSIPHFFGLMLSQAAGVQVPVIGFRGSAPLLNDLVGGHVPMAIDTLDSLLPQHETGKVRILATSGEKRAAPSIPTLKESGLNLSASGWNTFYAKSTLPADRVSRLAKEISEAMQQPAVRQKFIAASSDPVSAGLAQTRVAMSAFKAQWVPVIQKSGVKFD